MLIFGETHLRQILILYASYYNELRMHLSLHKAATRNQNPVLCRLRLGQIGLLQTAIA